MCFKVAVVTLACLGSLAAHRTQEKRQAISSIAENQDNLPAETGFTNPAPGQAAAYQGSKYFQYMHVPAIDHVDHGHKMGNEHHFIERHEKEHPHAGEFKTKVRWGDKHGGYGEHYWDYNHAGHDGDGEGSSHNAEYAEYEEESKPVPAVAAIIEGNQRGKREPQLLKDVEFVDDKARSLILESDGVQKHGGNYRREDRRGKREQARRRFGEGLVFDADSGVVVDGRTGARYNLTPVNTRTTS